MVVVGERWWGIGKVVVVRDVVVVVVDGCVHVVV